MIDCLQGGRCPMDARLYLRRQLGQSSSVAQSYLVDGRTITAAAVSPPQYYAPPHHYYQHQHLHLYHHQQLQQVQRQWLSVWNSQRTATSHDRKLFSIDSVLNLNAGAVTWRTDHESVSRLETSNLSGTLLLISDRRSHIGFQMT